MSVHPIQRIDVLVNPTSGQGKGARVAAEAVPLLQRSGLIVRVRQGRDADEAGELARTAAHEADALVVVGGDGLVQLAADALAGTDTPLGIVPAGTGNDAARHLSIDRKRVRSAVNTIIAGRTRRIDLAHAFGRHITTVIASGFDSAVNERANRMRWPRGPMRYNVATVAELMGFEPLRFTLELDGEVRELEAMLVAVGNGPSFGGGLRICEGAEIDDGLLDVAIIHPIGKAELVRSYPRLFTGSLVNHPRYERMQVRRVSLAAAGVVAYGDGERLGALPMTVEVRPGALRVFAPVS
ncbi:diacylglycerol/lipid kinase family protein [Solicola gregarius]|uniref:YegS/Rv2252/BmrU family lipid kinase n=1 Tax=Solicola gregarius TaxID=2908642 RepID=A0AA46THQ2_9ACTN|nr:YegS/Rv2252/BmrU family lipid kinase [Solicola gregarius]UYM05059.1 YegS/Rv2252/BmrU family lipid kinase [Solicola gregarius]